MSRSAQKFHTKERKKRRHGKILGDGDKGWAGRNWQHYAYDEDKEQRMPGAGMGWEK